MAVMPGTMCKCCINLPSPLGVDVLFFLNNIDGFINTYLCFNKFKVDQLLDKGVFIVFVVYRRITNRVF